jgi:tripartite ATP-independent transporter DctP family solute receptor
MASLTTVDGAVPTSGIGAIDKNTRGGISMATKISRRALLAAGGVALAPRMGRAAQVLRWSTVLPATHPETIMMELVAKQVGEETGGAVEIQIFPAGQLGSSRDTIESASSGAIQMVSEGAAQFGQFVPQFSILEAPYLWRDVAHMSRALHSPLMDELGALLASKRQMRVVGATYYGTRQLSSGTKPVKTVDDMKGFKIRIPEVDTFRAMAEAWGAKPTPLNIGELYLALSQGAVDGEENPLPTMQATKLNEVQKFLTLTSHVMTPRLVVVNEGSWSALSAASQATLKSAIAKHGADQDAEIVKQENALRATFAAGGMTVIEPDVESFRKPVLATLPAKFESKWGKGLWERVAAL